jgi:DNA-binding response OmpR family regulator
MANILVIDDDKELLRIMKDALESQGHCITCFDDARLVNAKQLVEFQLILLDIMLPNINGFEYCSQIRNKVDCPILFITSKNSDQDLLRGLSIGADDYIKKPFSIIELRARVEAHLRREKRIHQNGFTIGNIRFMVETKEVFKDSTQIHFTKSEYEICEFLAMNRDHTFSRGQIYEKIFGFDKDTYENVIVEHIKNIRNKLLQYGEAPIKTVWGIGYKWIE